MFRIAVIGGDERARRLAQICARENFIVTTMGLFAGDEAAVSIEKADILLFPYPYSVKGTGIPSLRSLYIDPSDVLAKAKDDAFMLAGEGLNPYVAAVQALGKPLVYKQYREDPAFLQDNTDISAEGALCYAMQQLDTTIAGTSVIVVGYGLFGKALAQKLRNLNANVMVAARSETARLRARSEGMLAVDLTELAHASSEACLLMNTVPARVIGPDELAALPPNALLLELASAPYGFDLEDAQRRGFSATALPSIPGRYAPESAAHALYQAMNRLLLTGKS